MENQSRRGCSFPIDFGRRAVAKRRVQPLSVVEDLDVVVQRSTSFLDRGPARAVREFLLQGAEEALDHRVVVAVAATAHADRHPVRGAQVAVGRARVLTAAIRMVQTAWFRLRGVPPQLFQH